MNDETRAELVRLGLHPRGTTPAQLPMEDLHTRANIRHKLTRVKARRLVQQELDALCGTPEERRRMLAEVDVLYRGEAR